ncbi:hypothetical protein BGW80DRAFT_1433698 [Lactifluus volemus]|nr:hypothetical protein BGW80DRAFT_1433698 [Lactifluus volemus]
MDADRPTSHGQPTLFDLLTVEPNTSIFFSYVREIELVRLFMNADSNVTVLVPTNKAVMALEKKPHQAPIQIEDDIKLTEQELEERSEKNVEHWVSLHIIPETNNDPSMPEWKRVLVNGNLQVMNMKEGVNGALYVIDGTFKMTSHAVP